jgi:heme-degrading monooxygenase HmoA
MFAQVITGKVTDREGLEREAERWRSEVRPGATGFLGATGGVTDDDTFILVARFESEDDARRNNDRPEQDESWARMEQCLADVAFAESNDVNLQMGGGRDDAGFVQVMRGRVLDEAAYADMMAKMDAFAATMKEHRPDVLGGLTVRLPDARYVDVIYFESEAAAREGEAREMPPDVLAEMEQAMRAAAVDEFLDLRQPLFF